MKLENCEKGKKACCTHHITFAPFTAAIIHDVKIASFAYYWAVKRVQLLVYIWLRLVADITRALIVMPTGRLRIMQIRVRLELKCFFFSYQESHIINNLITSTVRLLRENLKPRPSRIDLAIARSIRLGLSLRFSRNNLTFWYWLKH